MVKVIYQCDPILNLLMTVMSACLPLELKPRVTFLKAMLVYAFRGFVPSLIWHH